MFCHLVASGSRAIHHTPCTGDVHDCSNMVSADDASFAIKSYARFEYLSEILR